ncbi:MAG: phosphodiesterase [Clostridia bacterium]|nr:phosphodiesterase [Clostridia bacterium]
MKIMVVSDIHGSAYYCRQMLEAFEKENPNKLLCLGDILYHGPRNDLPEGYAPKEVIAMLNDEKVKSKIACVRGNCDTEVDQMVLDFPILADYCILFAGDRQIYATHGHVYGENNPPKLSGNDILLNGHTHVPACNQHDGYLYINPGSVSIPKENSHHGYMIIDDSEITWKSLDGEIKNRIAL